MTNIDKQIEFNKTLGLDKNIPNLTSEQNKLRLTLAFEELSELAKAYGLEKTFVNFCKKHIDNNNQATDTNEVNMVEVLDALVDIEIINNGSIIDAGLNDIYQQGYDQTHQNNLTKVHKTLELAENSKKYYENNGYGGLSIKQIGENYVLYRNDGKILKPSTYVANNLSNLLENR